MTAIGDHLTILNAPISDFLVGREPSLYLEIEVHSAATHHRLFDLAAGSGGEQGLDFSVIYPVKLGACGSTWFER